MSRSSDLMDEFDRAAERLLADEAAIRRMFDLGVDVDHWTRHRGQFGLWPLGIIANGSFIQPVVAYDEVVDLIAWPAADPATWRLRRGHAALMGEELAARSALFNEPIRVFATPFDWLKHFGEGCCVVNWDCFLPFHLDARRLLVSDPSLGNRLTRALAVPPVSFEIRQVAA